MPRIACTHVEVYLFSRAGGRVNFLALRRSRGRRLAGVWQPVTGKIDPGETALSAAVREVREEIGLAPTRWWALETMTTFFDVADDAIEHLPLFAAELASETGVTLSDEHDAHRFVEPAEARNLFLWDAQRRALDAVQREVIESTVLAEALAIPREAIDAVT